MKDSGSNLVSMTAAFVISLLP